jgi:hypothetical protein
MSCTHLLNQEKIIYSLLVTRNQLRLNCWIDYVSKERIPLKYLQDVIEGDY